MNIIIRSVKNPPYALICPNAEFYKVNPFKNSNASPGTEGSTVRLDGRAVRASNWASARRAARGLATHMAFMCDSTNQIEWEWAKAKLLFSNPWA